MPFKIIVALICTLVVLCGCDSKQSNVERGNAAKELFIGIGTEPAGLDPHLITGMTEIQVAMAFFQGLVTYNSETMEIVPGVAERWKLSDDGKIYTFYFNQEARWSNGDRVTPQDFLFSFERILTPALGAPYAYMLYPMKGAEAYHKGELTDFSQVGCRALDEVRLVIELENPTPFFMSLLTHNTWWPVHPPTILAHGSMTERISKWTKAGNLVSNGPFTLESWRVNSAIFAKKNPLYHDVENVALNGVHFLPIQADAEERAFRAGHLHLTSTVLAHRIDWYRKHMPESIRFDTGLGIYYYMLNTERPPLDDPRVRKALAYSIDREAITEHVLKAGQKPAYHFTPPNTGGDYTSQARMIYDPERARQLLAEAGFPSGEGFPTFEILYNTSEAHRSIAVAIQQMWKKELGIDVTLYNQEWKVYLATRRTGDFEVLRAAWLGDYDDPDTFLSLGESDNGNNHTRWGHPEFDRLMARTRIEQNKEKRLKLFQQAEAILMDEAPVIPIYFYVNSLLIHPSVEGWHANILDYHPFQDVSLNGNQNLPK